MELWTARADNTGEPEPTLRRGRGVVEGFWSGDAEWLVFRTDNVESGNGDILAIRNGEDSVPVPLATTNSTEQSPSLSPDGRFLAYASYESGRSEVVVTPFPNTGDWKEPVSVNGGSEPVWGSDQELFYRSAVDDLVSVEVMSDPEFTLGEAEVLFSAREFRADGNHAQYDYSPEGGRFLMIRSQDAGTYDLVFVGSFIEEIRAKVGG
jgi:hypothetical protein